MSVEELTRINSQIKLRDAKLKEEGEQLDAAISKQKDKDQELEKRKANCACEHDKELGNWRIRVEELKRLHERVCTQNELVLCTCVLCVVSRVN